MPKTETSNRDARAFVPRVQVIDGLIILVGAVLAIVGILSLMTLLDARTSTAKLRDRYEVCVDATTNLILSCDDLSSYSRLYVLTGNEEYFEKYYNEYFFMKRRERAIETLRRAGVGPQATHLLSSAYRSSAACVKTELHAMALVMHATGQSLTLPGLTTVTLTPEEALMRPGEARRAAEEMLLGPEYDSLRSVVAKRVDECVGALETEMRAERSKTVSIEEQQQNALFAVLMLFLVLLGCASVVNLRLLLRPLRRIERSIQRDEPFELTGSREIRNVVFAYNKLYEENKKRTLLLEHMAQADPLTGLLNRGSFDQLLSQPSEHTVLLAVDVDLFKEINDRYGHEVGDQVLRKVARELVQEFGDGDYACRIGGDEFAVVVCDPERENRVQIVMHLEKLFEHLRDSSDGIPSVTLSVGVASAQNLPADMTLYHAADKALYRAKHNGRNQYVFYDQAESE